MKRRQLLVLSIFFVSLLEAWPFFLSREEPVPPVPSQAKKIIVIDPAGDAENPGREIDDTLERSLTMQLAQELKSYLENKHQNLRVIFTRFPGETVEPLQNVSFANRLGAEVYLSINFFEQSDETPSLFFYTLMLDPATDFLEKKSSELALLPFDQTYKLSLKKTKEFATILYNSCLDAGKTYPLTCESPISLPFKPLLGITAPAVALEIGLRKHTQWKPLVPAITQALEKMVEL